MSDNKPPTIEQMVGMMQERVQAIDALLARMDPLREERARIEAALAALTVPTGKLKPPDKPIEEAWDPQETKPPVPLRPAPAPASEPRKQEPPKAPAASTSPAKKRRAHRSGITADAYIGAEAVRDWICKRTEPFSLAEMGEAFDRTPAWARLRVMEYVGKGAVRVAGNRGQTKLYEYVKPQGGPTEKPRGEQRAPGVGSEAPKRGNFVPGTGKKAASDKGEGSNFARREFHKGQAAAG